MQNLDDQADAGWDALTLREKEIVYPVLQGKPNKLIAMEFGISMRTVEAHRARIFQKMGVRNAVQLAMAVFEQGLVPAQSLRPSATDPLEPARQGL